MKSQFKPLTMAAAVAAASVGFAGSANAMIDAGDLGDLAIVPYYTTMAGYVTGVHITNTSGNTQVVKLRLRRGSDSMDALDFNLIMSPYDMWTGTVRMEDNGQIVFRTSDSTCTAPAPNLPGVGFLMPDPTDGTTEIDFREGAEEGYIEIIGMAQARTEDEPIAIAAEHEDLQGSLAEQPQPADCARVRDNFFQVATTGPLAPPADGTSGDRGVYSSSETVSRNDLIYDCDGTIDDEANGVCTSEYDDTDNVLMVSYFIRDAESGMEMGGKAVHISDFADDPMMSNQVQFDVDIEDRFSYFYPDLDGGNGIDAERGRYDSVIRPALGVAEIKNDWSVNAGLNVQTDWVITFPGQYTMVHWFKYIASLQDDGPDCNDVITAADAATMTPEDPYCDFRDIPAVLSIQGPYDREEQLIVPIDPEDELVVSPSVGETPDQPAILLPYEVNVIKWFGPDTDGDAGVLGSQYSGFIDVGQVGNFGWAILSVSPDNKGTATPDDGSGTVGVAGQRVCADKELPIDATTVEVDTGVGGVTDGPDGCYAVTNTAVPMIGFAAWKRSFPDRPDGNYGRLIDHSWTLGS